MNYWLSTRTMNYRYNEYLNYKKLFCVIYNNISTYVGVKHILASSKSIKEIGGHIVNLTENGQWPTVIFIPAYVSSYRFISVKHDNLII